jgi:hypothetical protein
MLFREGELTRSFLSLFLIGSPFWVFTNRIQFIRDLKDFFGVTFKIKEAKESEKEEYMLSCVGVGYTNVAKKT